MTTIIDKFNVIQDISFEINYPLISNFLENYLERDIIILLPGYINQLIWNKKFDIDVIEIICNEEIIKYLKNIKNNIKMLIKRDSYTLHNGLNKIIDIYLNKINYINNIFLFENKFINLFDTIILSEPIIINFVKEEIYMKNQNEIKIFYNNLKKINFDITRFMRLLKSIIIDNIPKIDYPIPDNLNSLYKLIIKLKYYDNLLNFYHFVTFLSLEELLLLIIDDIITIIEYFNFQEIKFVLKFLENNSDKFLRLKLNKLKKTLSNTIHVKYMLLDKNNIDNIEWQNLVEIIAIANDLKLLEDYILSIINDEPIQLTILNMVNNYNDIIIDKFFIIIHIKDKDVFFELYYQQLIRRLLSSICDFKKDEKLGLKLYVIIGPKNTIYKINKSIIDYKISQDINSSFYKNNLIPIETIITSYNNWTFNCNQGYVESNNYLDNILNKFNIYFKYMNKGKKLIWFPQYGEINIKFNKMELTMLPIQFMVLELFDENDKININEIKIFENYSNVFKENVIKSLELTNIIERQDTFIILNETKKLRTTNFINIFYNLNMEEQVIEILNLREDAVKCWINKLLKLTPLSFNNLLNETNRNIVLFTVDTPLLEKVINKMIEMDYIELNSNNEYCKLLY